MQSSCSTNIEKGFEHYKVSYYIIDYCMSSRNHFASTCLIDYMTFYSFEGFNFLFHFIKVCGKLQ